MIKSFSDHAANERTFLAWIQTAITIMAFGFLIERFDIFLRYLQQSITNNQKAIFEPSYSAEIMGLILMAASVVMIIGATIRYLFLKRAIESKNEKRYGSLLTNLLLGILLLLVFAFLAAYVGKQTLV